MWKLVLLVVTLASCHSSAKGEVCANPSGSVLNGSVSTAQIGGGCDDTLMGSAIGKPCKTGADCQPACCACPGEAGSTSVSVGYCKQGFCATNEESCCTFSHEELQPDGGSGLCP